VEHLRDQLTVRLCLQMAHYAQGKGSPWRHVAQSLLQHLVIHPPQAPGPLQKPQGLAKTTLTTQSENRSIARICLLGPHHS
jgi:hypothetical protein